MRALLVVFAVGLAVRLLHLAMVHGTAMYLIPPLDGEVYIATALQPIEGVYFQSPGYIHFLKAIFAFSTDPALFRIVQCVLGAGTATLTTVIARRVVSPRAALGAGLAIALCGPLVAVDVWPALESPNVFAQVALCAAVLAGTRGSERGTLLWPTLAGVLLGAAILIRPSALLLVPIVLLYQLVAGARGWARVRAAGMTAFAAALVVAPITAHNFSVGDHVLVTSSGGLNFYLGNGAGANGLYRVPASLPGAGNVFAMSEISESVAEKDVGHALSPSEVSDWFYQQTRADIAKDPGAWVRLLGKKVLYSLNWFEAPCSEDYYLERARSIPLRAAFVTFGLLAPLALLGVVAIAFHDKKRELLLVLGFVGATLATTVVYFYLGRYRLPALPFVAVLAALGVESAIALVRRRRPLPIACALVLVAGATALVHANVIPFDASQEFVKAGVSAIRLGRMDDAAHEFAGALRINRENAQALQNLAVLRERAGRRDDAIDLWTRLRDLSRRTGDLATVARAERALARLQPPVPEHG